MKKIFMLICIIFIVVTTFIFTFKINYSNENGIYEKYQPLDNYQQDYPVTDYVSEDMDTNVIFRNFMLYSLVNSEELLESDYLRSILPTFFIKSFFDPVDYNSYIMENQYLEPKQIYLTEVYDNDAYNYLYTGYLEDGTEVTGRLAIFEYDNNVALAISLLDEDGNPDPQLAALLSDDSNSEYLMYLIIQQIQEYLNTNMEPNLAAETYFDNSLEQLAGSFSYHALATKYILENGGSDYVMSHTKVINITKNDSDGIFVNRSL